MLTIGIECESTEGNAYGVGRNVQKLLEQLENRTDLRVIKYYKKNIPSFSLYYYIYLPIKIWLTRPDIVFFPNYMLPFGIFCKTIVVLTNDLFYEMTGKHLPFHYLLAYKIFGGNAKRNATMIMTHSQASKDDMVKLWGIKAERIFVNYLGVDVVQAKSYKLKATSYILFVGQALPRR